MTTINGCCIISWRGEAEERQRPDGAAMVSAVVSRGGVCVLKLLGWIWIGHPGR